MLQAQADLTAAQTSARSAEASLAAARNCLRILGKTDADDRCACQRRAYARDQGVGFNHGATAGRSSSAKSASASSSNRGRVYAGLFHRRSFRLAGGEGDEGAAATMHPGQRAEVRVPAYPRASSPSSLPSAPASTPSPIACRCAPKSTIPMAP